MNGWKNNPFNKWLVISLDPLSFESQSREREERERDRFLQTGSTFRGLERMKICRRGEVGVVYGESTYIGRERRVEGWRIGGINRDISRAEVRLDESNRSCFEGWGGGIEISRNEISHDEYPPTELPAWIFTDFPPWKWRCKWTKEFVKSSRICKTIRSYWNCFFSFKKEFNSELNTDVNHICLLSNFPQQYNSIFNIEKEKRKEQKYKKDSKVRPINHQK